MFIKSPYNYDSDIDSFKSGLDCSDDPSLAQQHMRDETDINIMVARFQRTGLPEVPPALPGVQDFVDVHDFRSAMQAVIDAQRAFGDLPSATRERFGNDPGRLLDFVADSSNHDEAVRLGLVRAPVVPADPPAPPAPLDPPPVVS